MSKNTCDSILGMLFFVAFFGVFVGPILIGLGAHQHASNKKWQEWEKLSTSKDFVERKCVVHAVVSCFDEERWCSGSGNKKRCGWECVERHTYLFALQQETTVDDSNMISNTTELTSSRAETTRTEYRACGTETDPLYSGPASQPKGCTRQQVGQKAAHRSSECGQEKCDFEPLGPAPFQVGGEYPCWEPSQQQEGSKRSEAYQRIEMFCGNTRCRKLFDPSIDLEKAVQTTRDAYNSGIAQFTAGIILTVASCCFCCISAAKV